MITIVIPVYNSSDTIKETINSVKNSTYKNWNCIIVNDGSIDNSEKIIEKEIKNDNRFYYIKTEHIGVANARNIAIEKAKTEYIFPLDSDDLLEPKFLENAINYLLEHKNCIFYFGKWISFGMISGILSPNYKGYKQLLESPCLLTGVFKRNRALEVGGYDNSLDAYEDYDFWVRYLYEDAEVKESNEIMLRYRTRPTSRHFSHSQEQLDKILKEIQNKNKKTIYQQ